MNLERLNLRDDSLGPKGILKLFETLRETSFSSLAFIDLSGEFAVAVAVIIAIVL